MPGYLEGADACWLRADHPMTGHRAALEAPAPPVLAAELATGGVQIVPADAAAPDERLIRFRAADALPQLTADLAAPGSYALLRADGEVSVVAGSPLGLLYGWFGLLRVGPEALEAEPRLETPAVGLRMLDHWDNMTAGPMGTVERGYAGDSLFFADGEVRSDLSRIRDYARLLASIGVNAVCLNNVNVHARETHLLTDLLPDVARVAEVLRAYGVATFLAVNFAAPIELGGLPVADPLDPDVARWWREATDAVYAAMPDFGGYVVKADSENRPGPFSYDRTHADGANMLAAALAPHGGRVLWRCFVYDCHQDWRDRSTDRARAAYDHFLPLDGAFADNVILQVKNGPIDFQVREPVSPLLGGLHRTHLGLEVQLTQEYTGQQRHICYLAGMWSEVLGFDFRDHDRPGTVADRLRADPGSAVVGVANVGTDPNWTGHVLAQANLYAFGRLAWDPALSPAAILDEWLGLTFPDAAALAPLRDFLLTSREVYESYTAPLGVGFMVNPGHHYGPSVDGYEYSPWGTYHFADRDGIGVDRTAATGTGYTQQYPPARAAEFESLDSCPDELVLFFHHVGYEHRLHSGRTLIQHIYDTHFDGVAAVEDFARIWPSLASHVPPAAAANIGERLTEQVRSAREWRDQITTYFLRHSGVPDERGRRIY